MVDQNESQQPKVKRLLRHLPYFIVLLVILLIFYHRFLNPNTFPAWDWVLAYVPRAEIIKQSIFQFGDFFPLWNPYLLSGRPFYADPTHPGPDYLLGPLLLLFPGLTVAIKVNYLLTLMIAGISMYVLMMYLTKQPRIAFIGAGFYMFHGFVQRNIVAGLTSLNPYSLLPFFFLFVIKATKTKQWIKNAIYAGVMFGLMFRGGQDLKVILWVAPLLGLYFLFTLLGKNPLQRLIKVSMIGLIISVIFFGLAAQRLLPEAEFTSMTSRTSLSFEQMASGKYYWDEMFNVLFQPKYEISQEETFLLPIKRKCTLRDTNECVNHIGFLGFLLLGFVAYRKRKNKFVLFLLSGILLAILLATGSFVLYLLWKYLPGYAASRHLHRTLVIYAFVSSILVGLGAKEFFALLKKKFRFTQKKERIVYVGVVALLLFNLLLGFSYIMPWEDATGAVENNYILQNISKQPGIFRIQTWETRGVDWGTEFYNIPLGLEHLYAYHSNWYPPYFHQYLGVSFRDPAKFWGILNVKYITAQNPINVSGFKFVHQFPNCTVCFPAWAETFQKAWGPYLYENEQFLPRAYIVDNSILVVGQSESALQTLYSLMLHPGFNPATTVIIQGKQSINDYTMADLNKFSAVLLTQGSVDEGSGFLLTKYLEDGGKLLPNVVEGKQSISDLDFEELLTSFQTPFRAIPDDDVITHNFDKKEIKVGKTKGFLVLSEKYTHFPGWGATAKNKNFELLSANGMNAAIYLDEGYDSIVFEYKPRSYRNGTMISVITIFFLIGLFIYDKVKKRK